MIMGIDTNIALVRLNTVECDKSLPVWSAGTRVRDLRTQ
jgi:hypothetical protein